MKSNILIFNLMLGLAFTTLISLPSYANDLNIYQHKLENIDNYTKNCIERQKNPDGNFFSE